MSKEILLTQGKITVVDDEDFDWLNQWKWCAAKRKSGLWYAIRNGSCKNGKQTLIQMHREILQPLIGMETDHKDGNGLNNQRGNLRVATHAQNQHNQKPQIGKSSRHKGVSWNRRAAKWCACISVKNRTIHLGYFDSEIEAAKAYNIAAQKYYGEFARLNSF